MVAQYLVQIKTLIHRISCAKNVFNPAIIKNYNGVVTMGKRFVQSEQNQPLHQIKKDNIGE